MGRASRVFTTGDVLTENAWNHVAATFDGTTYTIYVNGAAVYESDALAGKLPAPMRRFDIGRGATEVAGGGRQRRIVRAARRADVHPGTLQRARLRRYGSTAQRVWSGVPVVGHATGS